MKKIFGALERLFGVFSSLGALRGSYYILIVNLS